MCSKNWVLDKSRSGKERNVRQYLLGQAERLSIEVEVDPKGNLWFLSNAPEGEILLSAHMDKASDAGKSVSVGDITIGQLDDALGMSQILAVLDRGQRPSVVFTVKEESGMIGASAAAEEIKAGKFRHPKTTIVLEVSALREPGIGVLIYTRSAGSPDFPAGTIKAISDILKKEGIPFLTLPGAPNDSARFAQIAKMGLATLQVHVDRMHSPFGRAVIGDIMNVGLALRMILTSYNQLPQEENEVTAPPVFSYSRSKPIGADDTEAGVKPHERVIRRSRVMRMGLRLIKTRGAHLFYDIHATSEKELNSLRARVMIEPNLKVLEIHTADDWKKNADVLKRAKEIASYKASEEKNPERIVVIYADSFFHVLQENPGILKEYSEWIPLDEGTTPVSASSVE